MKSLIIILAFITSLFALKQDINLTTGTLENGLKYYIKHNQTPKNTANFYLFVEAGSVDEAPNERGLAHFVEHMAFNGSRDFSKNELVKKLESLGVRFGADLNAATSYDDTIYNLEIPVNEQNLQSVFKVFANWMDGVSFEADELDKERGVVIAEATQRNTPFKRLFESRANELYKNSIYFNKSPIGDMNVIKSVQVPQIKEFYHKIYQPRHMKIIAVGDFNASYIKTLIENTLSSIKNTNNYQKPNKSIPFFNGFNVQNLDANETGLNFVTLSFAGAYEPINSEQNAKNALLSAYISTLINNYFNRRQSELSTPLSVNFTRTNLQNQKLLYEFNSRIINADTNASVAEILGLINGIKQYKFSADDFELAKQNFLADAKINFESSQATKSAQIAQDIIYTITSGSTFQSSIDTYELNKKLLNQITLDNVISEFERILNLNEQTLTLISQNGDKISQKEFEILKANTKALQINKPYKKLPTTLISKNITPKKILKSEILKEQGVQIFTLENGAKVVLKELKTHKNRVEFKAISQGGSSNLDNPQQANYAIALSNLSGVGEFNNFELAKMINGKSISYKKYITPLTHGFRASSASSDILTLLELINLEFNSPRADENILNQLKESSIDAIKKSKDLPNVKFKTDFNKFYFNNHKRTREVTEADVAAFKLNELKDIIKHKFSNASNYTFFFVGDFKTQELKPLIEKYLATLPSKNERENFVDDGVRSIDGVHKFLREYQSVSRSEVSMRFKKVTNFSAKDKAKLDALKYVLNASLRENIREDKGQTYGFSTILELQRIPFEQFNATIAFASQPQNVEPIINSVKQIIKNLKQNGTDAKHLQNYKQIYLTAMDKNMQNADFWMDELSRHFILGNEIFSKSANTARLKVLNNDDIKEMARKYFSDDNLVISINNPKN